MAIPVLFITFNKREKINTTPTLYLTSMRETIERITPEVISLIAQKTDNIAIIANSNMEIQWVNEAFENITGYSFKEVLGKTPGFLHGPNTDKKIIAKMNRSLELGKEFKGELINYDKKGKPYWVDSHIIPIHNEKGDITSYIALEKDITDQKDFEDQLKEAQYRLNAIHKSINDYNFFIDTNRKVLAFSRAGEEIVRRTMGTRIKVGEDFREYIDPESIIRFDNYFDEVLRTKKTIAREDRIELPNNYTKWFYISYAPVFDDKKNILGVTFNAVDITERKEGEIKLKASEERLRTIYENREDSNLLVDTSFKILSFNNIAKDRIKLLFGKDIKVGDSLHKYITDESRDEINAKLNDVLTNKVTLSYESELIAQNGELFNFVSTYIPIIEKDKVVAISTNTTNVTNHKKAEQRLIDSEAKLKAVFNNSNEAKYFIDTKRRLLAFNDKAEALRHQINQEELILGELLDNFIPPNKVTQFKSNVSKCINSVKEMTVEDKLDTVNGEKWLRMTFNPVFDNKKQLWGVLIKQADITKEKHAQLKLKESEYKLRAVYESTLDSNILLDMNFNILSFNNIAQHFIKSYYNKSLKIGRSIFNISNKDDTLILKKRLDDLLKTKAPVSAESSRTFKSGVTAHFRFVYVPTFNRKGEIIGISINISDITARKLYEQQLEHKNKVLQDIAEMQSHGLRRPLANILGLGQLIEKLEPPINLKEPVEMLLKSTKELDEEVYKIVKGTHFTDNNN